MFKEASKDIAQNIVELKELSVEFVQKIEEGDREILVDISIKAKNRLNAIINDLLNYRDHSPVKVNEFDEPLTFCKLYNGIEPINISNGLFKDDLMLKEFSNPTLERVLNKMKHANPQTLAFRVTEAKEHFLFFANKEFRKDPKTILEINVQLFCDFLLRKKLHIMFKIFLNDKK